VLDCAKCFEVGRNWCVFGSLIPDNGMKKINAKTYLSGEAIDTIQGSKKNYSYIPNASLKVNLGLFVHLQWRHRETV